VEKTRTGHKLRLNNNSQNKGVLAKNKFAARLENCEACLHSGWGTGQPTFQLALMNNVTVSPKRRRGGSLDLFELVQRPQTAQYHC